MEHKINEASKILEQLKDEYKSIQTRIAKLHREKEDRIYLDKICNLMSHALGEGVEAEEPYRNSFVAGADHMDWKHLQDAVRLGWMTRREYTLVPNTYVFVVTEEGKRHLRNKNSGEEVLLLKKRISELQLALSSLTLKFKSK